MNSVPESAAFGLFAAVPYLGARLLCYWAPLTPERTPQVATWMLEEIVLSSAITSAVLWYVLVGRRKSASVRSGAAVGAAAAVLTPLSQALLHIMGVQFGAFLTNPSSTPI